VGFELNKRKAYLAIGLIVIVAVCGFIFYRYFVDWPKNTGDAPPTLNVVAKTDTAVTLSWEEFKSRLEEHDAYPVNYFLLMSTTGESDPSINSDFWSEIWSTTNRNITSTTVSDLSPDTTYWFYMAGNWHTYGMQHYGSSIIQITTYPSLFQTLITLAIISGAIAVALIFIRKPKWAMGIFVFLLLIQSYGLITSSVNASNNPTIVATQLWNFTTHGIVYPPPIVADGYIYTVSYSAYSSFVEVNCLNASTGTQIWNYWPRGFAGDLTVSEGYVYTSSTWGDLGAFNASTGAKIWNFTKENCMSAPVVADNRVYVTACGYIGSIENSIGFVFCFDAEKGTSIWNYTIEGSIGAPIVAGNMVYVPVRERFSTTRNVYALDARTGAKIWSYPAGSYAISSPVVGGSRGYVYVESGDGNVYALSSFTGNMVWNYTVGGFSGSPIIAGDTVYICSNNSDVYALDAKNGAKIWNYTVGDAVSSSIIAGNIFYIGAENTLYTLDAANGTKIWNFTTENPVVPAAGTDGYVYVGSSANNKSEIYCLDASSGTIIWNYTSKRTYGNVLCDALVYRIVVSGGIVYGIFNQVVSNPYSHIPNSIIYALEPTTVAPPLPLTVIVVVMDIVILAVAILVYRLKLKKGAESLPPATSPTQP
jgi:outer membrane protein assembly factor BamB